MVLPWCVPGTAHVATQLTAAGSSWSTVRGRTRWWRHDDLVGKAFTAHHQADPGGEDCSTTSTSRATTGDDPPAGITVTELAVAVQRVPWKLRADLLTAHGDVGHTEVLVVNGATFWAQTGPVTITNGGPRTTPMQVGTSPTSLIRARSPSCST